MTMFQNLNTWYCRWSRTITEPGGIFREADGTELPVQLGRSAASYEAGPPERLSLGDDPRSHLLDARALELAGLATMVISAEGMIVRWNRAAEEIYGYPAEEALDRPVGFLCLPGESTALLLGPREASDFGCCVERHRHRDGSEILVRLQFAAVGDGLLTVARDITARQEGVAADHGRRAALEASRREVRRLGRRILDAQEDERRRIARELHDDFKQRLAALGFNLAALAEGPLEGDVSSLVSIRNRLVALVGRVSQLGDDIRRVSHELHPASLERLGLAAALESLAAEARERHALEVRVTVRSSGPALPQAVALGLYRIAQEALANAGCHAGLGQAHLTLVRDENQIRLALTDDGPGFDVGEARARSGLGLASMEERARLLGGRLRLASEPGAGTEIEVIVPLVAEHADDGPIAAADEVETTDHPRPVGPHRLLSVHGEATV